MRLFGTRRQYILHRKLFENNSTTMKNTYRGKSVADIAQNKHKKETTQLILHILKNKYQISLSNEERTKYVLFFLRLL